MKTNSRSTKEQLVLFTKLGCPKCEERKQKNKLRMRKVRKQQKEKK